MPRTARVRHHFIEAATWPTSRGTARDYVVEVRQGQVRYSLGRISGGGGGQWNALAIGADAWSRWHRTRTAALAALQARETFTDETTWIQP
jgi:hypothetical protein